MDPKNNASPERIAVGSVVLISDGTVQTSAVSITVVPQGGASGAGGGTTTYEQGIVFEVPTQAETNYTSFIVTAYKASCFPVSQTVVTTASSTAGQVDVKSIAGTAQTANDNGADINTLLTRIVGTLATGTHNPATAAQIAVLSDWINGGRLDLLLDAIPTTAMRGTDSALLAADISLTGGAVDTVTTLTNKTGFSLAATGLDLVLVTSTFVAALIKGGWDRVLSKANHNISRSSGRL